MLYRWIHKHWNEIRIQVIKLFDNYSKKCRLSSCRVKHSHPSIQLPCSGHLSQRFNRLVHCHLRLSDLLLLQLLVLLSPLFHILDPPLEGIGHMVIMLRQPGTVGNRVRDERTARLPEINLHRPKPGQDQQNSSYQSPTSKPSAGEVVAHTFVG